MADEEDMTKMESEGREMEPPLHGSGVGAEHRGAAAFPCSVVALEHHVSPELYWLPLCQELYYIVEWIGPSHGPCDIHALDHHVSPQSDRYKGSTHVEDANQVFDEMLTSDFDYWRPPNRILEVTIRKSLGCKHSPLCRGAALGFSPSPSSRSFSSSREGGKPAARIAEARRAMDRDAPLVYRSFSSDNSSKAALLKAALDGDLGRIKGTAEPPELSQH
ncbi:hypothetical protein HU200_041988 [Digitaria exilis]|uniref:Uncharacterized protein n=1 Tax=Digitaria exilis TaxID=1010633 RepID=A0A835B5P3_9POAL|nr:hypothetical protein HU200_041988 [Digitaria exilis]